MSLVIPIYKVLFRNNLRGNVSARDGTWFFFRDVSRLWFLTTSELAHCWRLPSVKIGCNISMQTVIAGVWKRIQQLDTANKDQWKFGFPLSLAPCLPGSTQTAKIMQPLRPMPGVRPGRTIRGMCASIGQGAPASRVRKHDKGLIMTQYVFYFFFFAGCLSILKTGSPFIFIDLDGFSTGPWWIGWWRTAGTSNLSPVWHLTLHCVHFCVLSLYIKCNI